MALYMNLVRLSSAGAKAVLKDGMAGRVANAEKTLAAVGGKVLGYYAIADGDYDYVAIMEIPDSMSNADAVRSGLTLKQTGAFDEIRLMRLASAAEVDSGSKVLEQTYRAPGQS